MLLLLLLSLAMVLVVLPPLPKPQPPLLPFDADVNDNFNGQRFYQLLWWQRQRDAATSPPRLASMIRAKLNFQIGLLRHPSVARSEAPESTHFGRRKSRNMLLGN